MTIGYLVLGVISVLVFAFVLQPLVSARKGSIAVMPQQLADLGARRAYLVDAIRDADFDHALGKMGDGEYQETRTRYVREAAEVLRDLEHEAGAVNQEIDREILQLRELARRPAPPPEAAPPAS